MRWILISYLMAMALYAHAQSEKMEESGHYYSSLNQFFIETYHLPITKNHLERLERLLFFTGIEILEDYDHNLLDRYPTSSTQFILGRRSFLMKDFKKSLEYFNRVHTGHRYYPESLLLKAQVYGELKNYSQESEVYYSCQKSAESEEKKSENIKIKRYYRMIYEVCLVNKARRLYKEGKYQEAIESYDQIPKQSYKWPYIILEKAWAYYQMGEYNRTLGLLVTYKSPLLDTYFFPEAEYLAALTYFRLCLYEDASIIIGQYYSFYRPRFAQLESVLRKNVKSQNYFYNLMFRPGKELGESEDFVKQIMTRLKKQIRFSLDFNTIHKINQEIARIKSKEMREHLESVRENMVSKINYNAKKDIFQFLDTVPFFSSELFKVNLEIISKKKDLVYSNKKLVADRSRGDYSNVNRTRFEYFWKFEGAFWADELGDYSLGLKSNCQTVRIQSEKE